MFIKTFRPLALAATVAVIAIAALFPESARSADLRLKMKPAVEDTSSDWQARLFEEFKRYLRRRNQEAH
jgi:hypothetical protein